MFFVIFCFTAFDTNIKPVISPMTASSAVAQTVKISIPKDFVHRIQFSMGENSFGRMFYGTQREGNVLAYSSNYRREDSFFLEFYNEYDEFIPEGDYSFKLNSNFDENDEITVRLIYENDHITEIGISNFPNIAISLIFLILLGYESYYNAYVRKKPYTKRYLIHMNFCIITIIIFNCGIMNIFQYPVHAILIGDQHFPNLLQIEPFVNHFSYLKDSLKKIKNATDMNYTLDNCKFCSYSPIRPPSSTKRDLVIAQIGHHPERAIYSLLSLRTVGCKATIIATVRKQDIVPASVEKDLNDCGIFIVRLDRIYDNGKFEFMKIGRYAINAEFLEMYPGKFDRVFYYDSFDTVFQADPFFNEMRPGILYLSPEYVTFKDDPWVLENLVDVPGFNFSWLMDKEVFCSGVYSGYTDVIIKLGQLMKAMYRGTSDFVAKDQILFDYLYYSGAMETAGISTIRTPDYMSAWYTICQMPFQEVGNITIHNEVPAVVHQINRNKKYLKNAHEVCHVEYVNIRKRSRFAEFIRSFRKKRHYDA